MGLINYPRFPSPPDRITARASLIAKALLSATHQQSALVMTPETTIWVTIRPENA